MNREKRRPRSSTSDLIWANNLSYKDNLLLISLPFAEKNPKISSKDDGTWDFNCHLVRVCEWMSCKESKIIYICRYCLNVSTTLITAMGCRQCLSLSVVQLKGKHCQKTHCRNGVVGKFRPAIPVELSLQDVYYTFRIISYLHLIMYLGK